MDSLTHGLLGLAVGALRPSDRDRVAVLVSCVLAAELPDLDYLWPADNPVLHSLRAHRGLTHAVLAAPVVALVAAALTKLAFRKAPALSLLLWSLPAVLFAHLLADAWTGWGTRLLLPFSDARVTLDWMMVIDQGRAPVWAEACGAESASTAGLCAKSASPSRDVVFACAA